MPLVCRIKSIKCADPFATKTQFKTKFAPLFSSGGIPCRLFHGAVNVRLQWSRDPASLDYDPLLVTCAEVKLPHFACSSQVVSPCFVRSERARKFSVFCASVLISNPCDAIPGFAGDGTSVCVCITSVLFRAAGRSRRSRKGCATRWQDYSFLESRCVRESSKPN